MPVLTDLTVNPAPIASPLQTIGQLAALKGAQAETALRQAQIQTQRSQQADVQAQADQRNRALADQKFVQNQQGDPAIAKAFGMGDFSAIQGKVSPEYISHLRTVNDAHHKEAAATDTVDLENKGKRLAQAVQTFTGVLMDPSDPSKEADDATIAARYPSAKANLVNQGIIPPEIAAHMPDTIKSKAELKGILSDAGYFHGVVEAALKQAEAAGKVTAQQDTHNASVVDLGKKKTDAAVAAVEAPVKEAIAGATLADPLHLTPEQRRQATQAETTAAEAARHNKSTEATTRAEVALKQKTFDATFGSGLDANGQPLSAEAMKAAALQDPTAQAIANYQLPGPPVQTRGGAPSPILRKVLAINPNYDGTQFQARNKVQQDFSAAGASGKAITSADTALAHLDTLSKAGALLNNGNLPALNQLANAIGVQAGSDPKIVYDGIVRMVAPELSKAVIGATGGEGERQDMAHGLTSNNNDKAREGLIASTAGLLYARVKKQAHAYESSMGVPLDVEKRLSPESVAVMKRYSGGGSGGGHSVGDTVSVGGKKVKITAIHSDGTFDGNEVK